MKFVVSTMTASAAGFRGPVVLVESLWSRVLINSSILSSSSGSILSVSSASLLFARCRGFAERKNFISAFGNAIVP